MIKWFKNWLKFKLAGEELNELHVLKLRTSELQVWCTELQEIHIAASWLLLETDYPCQLTGSHGSIGGFREYLRKLYQCPPKHRRVCEAYLKGSKVEVWDNVDRGWANAPKPDFAENRDYRIKP